MNFEIIQNDLLPALTATLSYADGTAVDLAGAAVNLVLRNPDATNTYLNAACTIAGSTVTYAWASGDTAIAGEYVGEFVVTFSDTTIQSFPTEGYFPVTITPSLTGTTKPKPSYLTTADLIWQTRVHVDGRVKPGRNKLLNALDTVSDTLTFAYDIGGAAAGVALSIGLESLYVWVQNARTLTVERGAEGTMAAQHAAGDVVLINPEFTDAKILDAINQTLTALPSGGVYQLKTLDLSLTGVSEGYDLAADVESVLDVRWQNKADPTDWTAVTSFEVQRNMPTTVFPSGVALFITDRPHTWPSTDTNALRVKYRTVFTPLVSLFDDVLQVTGIPESATDLLPLGAALRLMAGRPVQRVFNLAQPDARNGLETKVGDVLNAPAALRQLFTSRMQDEADKLSRENVYRQPARSLMGSRSLRRRW